MMTDLAITLSSNLCKLLDVIIFTKCFKQRSSTGLCTTMVQETISYCVHTSSNVYSLILDASYAFNCILLHIILNFTGK